jgi:hypothetical protein
MRRSLAGDTRSGELRLVQVPSARWVRTKDVDRGAVPHRSSAPAATSASKRPTAVHATQVEVRRPDPRGSGASTSPMSSVPHRPPGLVLPRATRTRQRLGRHHRPVAAPARSHRPATAGPDPAAPVLTTTWISTQGTPPAAKPKEPPSPAPDSSPVRLTDAVRPSVAECTSPGRFCCPPSAQTPRMCGVDAWTRSRATGGSSPRRSPACTRAASANRVVASGVYLVDIPASEHAAIPAAGASRRARLVATYRAPRLPPAGVD